MVAMTYYVALAFMRSESDAVGRAIATSVSATAPNAYRSQNRSSRMRRSLTASRGEGQRKASPLLLAARLRVRRAGRSPAAGSLFRPSSLSGETLARNFQMASRTRQRERMG